MSRNAQPRVDDLFAKAYTDGYAHHGDLGLGVEEFAAHLLAIVEKYVGKGAAAAAALGFVDNLHIGDLYLAAACAKHGGAAWNRFMALYQKYLNDTALSFSRSVDAAHDLASGVLVDMFLPDRSGRSRIASYHGRSSLATWLRVIVCNRAINERENKYNTLERIESIPELPETAAVRNMEAVVRAARYEEMIKESLKIACRRLTDRERLLLLLRYDEELQVSQIARLLGVNPSTVTRQLDRVQSKLRDNVVSTLASRFNLQEAAIQECLADLLDNPSHSILVIIKEC